MNKKIFSLGIIILLIFAITISSTAISNKTIKSNADKKLGEVILANTLEVEQIPELIKGTKAKIVALKNKASVEGREYYGYYMVNSKLSLEDTIKDYKEQYISLLTESITALEEQISQTGKESTKDSLKKLLKDTIKRKEKIEKDKKIEIYSFVVAGDEEDFTIIKEKNKGQN